MSRKKPQIRAAQTKKSPLSWVCENLDSAAWVLVWVFLFRAFVAEAFVIPTGSMADTLRGAHFRITCPNCAYRYNFGFIPRLYSTNRGQELPDDYIPPRPIDITPTRSLFAGGIPLCPMCGARATTDYPQWVNRGDQILVLKYLYQFFEPQTWDVVVFKNPVDPTKNFIKRLIGRPEETVEIIDGDIYINGRIQSKPPRVQNALWIPLFNSDLQPVSKSQNTWPQPFHAPPDSAAWTLDQPDRQLEFKGSALPAPITFDSQRLAKLLANFIAYNGPRLDTHALASDLKLDAVLTPHTLPGKLTLSLGKYGRTYRADIDFSGACSITDESTGQTLVQQQFAPLPPERPVEISFAIVDHRFELRVGVRHLAHIGPNDPNQWGYHHSAGPPPSPTVALAGQGGSCTLEHLLLCRDIHYSNFDGIGRPGRRAVEGHPLHLKTDQFFVLGDNSPASDDGRFWEKLGQGNDHNYPAGIVPRSYLIGRAFFVVWPAGFHIHDQIPLAFIPNFGQMRFIH